MEENKSPKKSKKILLIKPLNVALPPHHDPPFPLGLASIGTVLKNAGYDVKIVDAMYEPEYKEEIMAHAKDALIVGIGVWTAEIKSAYEISRDIKDKFDVPIVWGSWHPTLFPEQTIKDKLVNYVLANEGEYSFLSLANELLKGDEMDLSKIPGLFYKENGEIKSNPRGGHIDLNTLPETDYSLLDVEKYIKGRISTKERRVLPYESSRGCPHRCAFCINNVANNRVYRTKSVEKTLNEIERMVKKYRLDYIAFQEDNFFVDKERVKKICEGIIKRRLRFEWFAECRADYFKAGHINEEIWALAKKAGLHTLTIGAESGSELSLRIMKKDITLQDTINAARICNAKGIIPAFSFIMGMPGEEKKEIYKTVDLICTLTKICPSMCSGINVFFPYPKCELTRGLVEKGLLKEPTTLDGWVKENDELMGMYINLYSKKNINRPWQKNFGLIQNISYYVNLSLRYSEPEIEKFIKNRSLRYYPYIFFRFLAKERMKHKFFGLTIDKWLYERINRIYAIFKHKI